MTRLPRLILADILGSIRLIERYTLKADAEAFEADTQLQDSVLRRLEIIGEAVKHLPMSFRGRYPDVPWRQLAGLRDVLIHQYSRVDLHLTWTFVEKDLPSLRRKVEEIIADSSLQ